MKKFAISAAVATMFVLPAQAQNLTRAYIQANIGSLDSHLDGCTSTWIDTNTNTVLASYGPSQTSCKTKGPSGKLLAGYKITPNFALEATYWSFGKEVLDDPISTATAKLTAFGLGGALHFDLTDAWSVIGRFGFQKTKAKYSYVLVPGQTVITTIPSSGDLGSESHPKYYAGGGLAFQVAPGFKLHGDLDYTKVRGENVAEHGIQLLSVGASVSF